MGLGLHLLSWTAWTGQQTCTAGGRLPTKAVLSLAQQVAYLSSVVELRKHFLAAELITLNLFWHAYIYMCMYVYIYIYKRLPVYHNCKLNLFGARNSATRIPHHCCFADKNMHIMAVLMLQQQSSKLALEKGISAVSMPGAIFSLPSATTSSINVFSISTPESIRSSVKELQVYVGLRVCWSSTQLQKAPVTRGAPHPEPSEGFRCFGCYSFQTLLSLTRRSGSNSACVLEGRGLGGLRMSQFTGVAPSGLKPL